MGGLAIPARVSGLSAELCTLLGMRPASPLHFSPDEAVWEEKDLKVLLFHHSGTNRQMSDAVLRETGVFPQVSIPPLVSTSQRLAELLLNTLIFVHTHIRTHIQYSIKFNIKSISVYF